MFSTITFKKYKRDIIFLLVLSLIVLPSLVATVVLAASFSTTFVSFGNVEINDISDRSVIMTNDSGADITGSVTATNGFSCVGGCSYNNLPASSSIVTTFRFAPTATSTYTSSGEFSTGDGTGVACSANEQTQCEFFHPYGWWNNGLNCIEYFQSAPGPNPPASTTMNVGESLSGEFNYCPSGSCHGDFTVTCNADRSLTFSDQTCKAGLRP